MKTNQFCTQASRLAFSAFMLHGVNVDAAPIDFTGRGVFHFASASGCPPGGRDPAQTDCNRIAIDLSEAKAAVDMTNHSIVFSSNTRHNKLLVVGDVLLQGSGVSKEGHRVPLSLHVLLRREGEHWDLDSYIHAPVGGKFSDVSIDPYQISVREGTKTRVILTPEQARSMFADSTLRKRLARAIVDVQSSDSSNPATGNITIALGFGKLSTSVLQVGFTSNRTHGPVDVDHAFQSGNWAVELEALSNHIPKWIVQREFFLFGLENQAALRTVLRDGFKNHDKLTFGARDGKGFLVFNGREAPFSGAIPAGHAFMQESFMGLILTWRRDVTSPAVDASPSATEMPKS